MTGPRRRARLARRRAALACGMATVAATLVLVPAGSARAAHHGVVLPPRSTPVSVSMSGTFDASATNATNGTGWVEHMTWSVSWSGTLGTLFNNQAWTRMKALERIPGPTNMQQEVTSKKNFNTAEVFAFQHTKTTGTITGTYRPQCVDNPQPGSKFPACNKQGLGPITTCPTQHLVPVQPNRPTFSATIYGFPLSSKTKLQITPGGGQQGTWQGIPANSLATGNCYGAGPYLYGSQAGGQLVGGAVSFSHGGSVPFHYSAPHLEQRATLVVMVNGSGSHCPAPPSTSQPAPSKGTSTPSSNGAGASCQEPYAALGDSYTAGAFTPFVEGGGRCLRSQDAYPELYDKGKVDFLACSGVKSAQVLADQVNQVPKGTKLVSITVGGDDVPLFPAFLGCWMQDVVKALKHVDVAPLIKLWHLVSGSPLWIFDFLDYHVTVNLAGDAKVVACDKTQEWKIAHDQLAPPANEERSSLVTLFKALKGRAKRVYVLGYPDPLPPHIEGKCPNFERLSIKGTFLSVPNGILAAEIPALQQLIEDVNTVVRAAANEAGVNYVPPSPKFAKHTLCAKSSWFIPLEVVTQKNPPFLNLEQATLHPNAQGQRQMMEDLRAAAGPPPR